MFAPARSSRDPRLWIPLRHLPVSGIVLEVQMRPEPFPTCVPDVDAGRTELEGRPSRWPRHTLGAKAAPECTSAFVQRRDMPSFKILLRRPVSQCVIPGHVRPQQVSLTLFEKPRSTFHVHLMPKCLPVEADGGPGIGAKLHTLTALRVDEKSETGWSKPHDPDSAHGRFCFPSSRR